MINGFGRLWASSNRNLQTYYQATVDEGVEDTNLARHNESLIFWLHLTWLHTGKRSFTYNSWSWTFLKNTTCIGISVSSCINLAFSAILMWSFNWQCWFTSRVPKIWSAAHIATSNQHTPISDFKVSNYEEKEIRTIDEFCRHHPIPLWFLNSYIWQR